MQLLGPIFAFILVIVVLVFVHELGHFLAARLTGMRVDVFAIGMGRRLFGYNKITGFSFGPLAPDWQGNGITDYRISLFPIGGYVSIVGMVDESMDDSFKDKQPEPWEFRSKNALQKIFVLSAGVLMNIILAVGIFATISLTNGKEEMATTTLGWIEKGSVAEQAGFMTGDSVVSINNNTLSYWSELLLYLALDDIGGTKTVVVHRNGADTTLSVAGQMFLDAVANKQSMGFMPAQSAVLINGVETLKPAGKIGLRQGDTIVSINNIPIYSTQQFIQTVKSNINPPQEMTLAWKRNGSLMQAAVTPDNSGTIGVLIAQSFTGKTITKSFGVGESLAEGFSQTISSLGLIVDQMKLMFQGSIAVKDSVGGPIMIAKVASQQASFGLLPFLIFLAQLSVMLAFMNILPLPVLDGGHILIVLIEAIIRRELPLKVKMGIQQAGMALMLVLTIIIFYLDLTR